METCVNERDGGIDIQCRNFEICESWFIIENLHTASGELCFNCDVSFSDWENGKHGNGILIFKDDTECPICLETTRCVKFPKCNHYICITDFKRCFYGQQRINEPQFPYPELEDDYYLKNQGHPYYENDPVIIKYHEEWNNWDNYYESKMENEQNLRKCPLCRK